MSRHLVLVISDDSNVHQQMKTYCETNGYEVQTYNSTQWYEGMHNDEFVENLSCHFAPSTAPTMKAHGDNVLPFPAAPAQPPRVTPMNEIEAKAIRNAIIQYKGNLTEAAKALGIGRATLYRKVKSFRIDPNIARRRRVA